MLVEGLVAVIALATVMMLAADNPLVGQPPLTVYGTGISRFAAVLGVPEKLGFSFGLLALSTFILTTLDTATRLGRYIFEEFFQLHPVRPGTERRSRHCAAHRVRSHHIDGCSRTADSGLEKHLARVRCDQPITGRFDVCCAGRLAAKDGTEYGVHLGAAGFHDGRHALCARAPDSAIRFVVDRGDRRHLARVGDPADLGGCPYESAAIRGQRKPRLSLTASADLIGRL